MTRPEFPPLRFHHVGVAVSELPSALEFYQRAFGYTLRSGPFDDSLQQASVAFISGGPDEPFVVELIAPLGEQSHVARLIEKGVGAYHICYETDDLTACCKHVSANGCMMVRPPLPATAFDGRKIAWLYTPARQLLELLEASAG